MKASAMRWTNWSATAAAAILLLACQQSPQSSGTATDKRSISAEGLPTADLKAVAEPFETIAEQAFTADPDQLRGLITKAEASYGAVKPTLTPQQRNVADGHVAAIRKAEQQRDSVGTALASVEMYRMLLEDQNSPGDLAIRAGLLDYAGFRYDALAQASEVRWPDMARTVEFAGAEWNRLAPSINDKSLREQFSTSLKAMSEAADKRDRAAARKAAAAELQLVDLLEKQLPAEHR